MSVLVFPPKLSLSSFVSFESRYGGIVLFFWLGYFSRECVDDVSQSQKGLVDVDGFLESVFVCFGLLLFFTSRQVDQVKFASFVVQVPVFVFPAGFDHFLLFLVCYRS